MKEYNLLEDMRYWQPERPDEWKMNEFIRGVKKLSQELQEKRGEVEALKAYAEQLRGALQEYDTNGIIEFTDYQALLEETPAQSLRNIESRVEEETIERVVMRDKWDGKFKKIPIDEATKTPATSGLYKLYSGMYWGVTEDDCILLYRGYAPQCNSNKAIAESIISGDSHVATKVAMLPAVWFEHECDA